MHHLHLYHLVDTSTRDKYKYYTNIFAHSQSQFVSKFVLPAFTLYSTFPLFVLVLLILLLIYFLFVQILIRIRIWKVALLQDFHWDCIAFDLRFLSCSNFMYVSLFKSFASEFLIFYIRIEKWISSVKHIRVRDWRSFNDVLIAKARDRSFPNTNMYIEEIFFELNKMYKRYLRMTLDRVHSYRWRVSLI